MAKNTETTEKLDAVTEPVVQTVATPSKKSTGAVYSLEEIVRASGTLGYPQEVIVAAFKIANVKTATEAEAKDIIEKYLKKEVK